MHHTNFLDLEDFPSNGDFPIYSVAPEIWKQKNFKSRAIGFGIKAFEIGNYLFFFIR